MGKSSVSLILLLESIRDENRPHPENRIERNGAGVLGPTKADWGQTGAQLGRNLRRTWASWLQLRPSLSPTGVQHGAAWACLDVSATWSCVGGICRGSWAQDKTNVGNMPHQSQKTLEIASFQFFALSPQNWPGWARAAPKGAQLGPSCAILDATGAQVGANGSGGAEVGSKSIRMHPKLKPYDAHGGPRHVQSGATCIPLATASQEVGPNGDTLTRRKNVG